jgi:hypothetical protein
MMSYMPGAQAGADMARDNLATLHPLLANQENAYYDMGRMMEELELAYGNVKNGTIPVELENKLNQIYENQMTLGSNALNKQYDQNLTQLMDQLGGRGILSSTTSSQAQTGLNSNLMEQLQNMELEYGTDKLQQMIDAPYRIFDAATNLYNASGQKVSAAGDVLAGGLGIQNAYNQNASNYLNLANQANSNYGQLINSANSQAQYGQSALTNLMNQIGAYQNQAGVASNIYGNALNPVMDMWSQLLGAETSKLVSGQGQSASGPSIGDSILGGLAGAIPDLIGGLF